VRALALALLVGCAHSPSPAGQARPDPMRAAAGVQDKAFRDLLIDQWTWTMRHAPEWATALGEHAMDDQVSARSIAAAEEGDAARGGFLRRANALSGTLTDARDAMFLDVFVQTLQSQVDTAVCHDESWSFSPRMNPMADLFDAVELQPVDTDAQADALLRRLTAFRGALADHQAALKVGVAQGRVVNRTSAERTLAMVDAQLAKSTIDWSFANKGPTEPSAPRLTEWPSRLHGTIDGTVRPALTDYAGFLRDVILPAARPDDHPGLSGLPDMQGCYAALVRHYVTRDLSPADLHQTGLDQMAKVHAEIADVGERVFGTRDVPTILARLRDDPSLRFRNADEIVASAVTALARAQSAVPKVFGHLPKTPCGVEVIPDYAAPYTTIAYYQQPNPDGSKQGSYFVNTHEPTTRARFESEVLAFHESVPGHHLQIATAYELPAAPAFHRYDGATAFVEGWGLYSERLADELGLYSSDLTRLGMLSFDAWRAARLVVDTGLHAQGWSRAQAEAYLRDNTALAEQNVVNEVDRYVTWPGQALAYKTGQIELLALRAEAQARLGDRFDLSAFHDVILGEGALPLDVLRARVERWITASGG
jgi:uncharacterized protein (DUF885 family)